MYSATKSEMQALMERRDVTLFQVTLVSETDLMVDINANTQERSKLLTEKRLLMSKPAPDMVKIQEIDEELERVETETDIQSEAIQSRQEEVILCCCLTFTATN